MKITYKKADKVDKLTQLSYLKNFKSIKLFFLLVSLLIATIISPNFISAVDIQFTKNSSDFSQGETLIAKISGNFIDQITLNKVTFYKEHERIPMDFDIVKIQDDFYIYAFLLNKFQGNYSFNINGVSYYKGAQIVSGEIIKNFTINENLADFYVKPGTVLTENNFQIEVQNLKENQIEIQIDNPSTIIPDSEKSLTLKSGEIKKIDFSVGEEASGIYLIEFISQETIYYIPVFVDKEAIILEKDQEFEFRPEKINISMPTDSDSKRIFYLLNIGSNVTKINLTISQSLTSFIKINQEKIENLKTNESQKIEITIESDSDEKVVEGKIFAVSENFSTQAEIILNFIKDYVPLQQESETVITTCSQINGQICAENQTCTKDTTPTNDGNCCISPAVCEEKKESIFSGKLIGWVIFGVIVLILFWFYRRYKKVKK